MITGTARFVSRTAALAYYRPYNEPGTNAAEVTRKEQDGEISYEKPTLKSRERLIVREGRYHIETVPLDTTAVCKPFSTGKRGKHRIRIEGDSVSVWDAVAGHYTTCHVLSARSVRRIIKQAEKDEADRHSHSSRHLARRIKKD